MTIIPPSPPQPHPIGSADRTLPPAHAAPPESRVSELAQAQLARRREDYSNILRDGLVEEIQDRIQAIAQFDKLMSNKGCRFVPEARRRLALNEAFLALPQALREACEAKGCARGEEVARAVWEEVVGSFGTAVLRGGINGSVVRLYAKCSSLFTATLLDAAKTDGRISVLWLLDNGKKRMSDGVNRALLEAARDNRADTLQLLLDYGDVTQKMAEGALLEAVRNNSGEVISRLLSAESFDLAPYFEQAATVATELNHRAALRALASSRYLGKTADLLKSSKTSSALLGLAVQRAGMAGNGNVLLALTKDRRTPPFALLARRMIEEDPSVRQNGAIGAIIRALGHSITLEGGPDVPAEERGAMEAQRNAFSGEAETIMLWGADHGIFLDDRYAFETFLQKATLSSGALSQMVQVIARWRERDDISPLLKLLMVDPRTPPIAEILREMATTKRREIRQDESPFLSIISALQDLHRDSTQSFYTGFPNEWRAPLSHQWSELGNQLGSLLRLGVTQGYHEWVALAARGSDLSNDLRGFLVSNGILRATQPLSFGGEARSWQGNLTELAKNPGPVLDDICEKGLPESVKLQGTTVAPVDAGGPYREFISVLMGSLRAQLPMLEEALPKIGREGKQEAVKNEAGDVVKGDDGQVQYRDVTLQADEALYRKLGKVYSFIDERNNDSSESKAVAGPLFEPVFLTLVQAVAKGEAKSALRVIVARELMNYPSYRPLASVFVEAENRDKLKEYMVALALCSSEEAPTEEQWREGLETAEEKIDEVCSAAKAFYEGLSPALQAKVKDGIECLNAIQGELSAEIVLRALEKIPIARVETETTTRTYISHGLSEPMEDFIKTLPPEDRETFGEALRIEAKRRLDERIGWIENAVQREGKEGLAWRKKFVRAVTGSNGLYGETRLNIGMYAGPTDRCKIATCFQTILLPLGDLRKEDTQTEEEFMAAFDLVLDNPEDYSAM